MRDLKMKDLPTFLAACIFCIGLLFVHSSSLKRTGRLPGEIETFRPSEPVHHFGPPAGEEWHFAPVASVGPGRNVYALGPLGPDGKIVPRSYFALGRLNEVIETYTDETGALRWRERGTPRPASPVGWVVTRDGNVVWEPNQREGKR